MSETKTENEFDELVKAFDAFKLHHGKFYNKNIKSSCTKGRKELMNIQKLTKIIRQKLLEDCKKMPVKKRSPKKK